ncbi:PP2C family protein-serine/threonine phosphatase [Nocardioides pakistanensis]
MTGDRSQLVGAVLATTWLVVFVGADAVTAGASFILSPLFAIAPLIACAVLPGRVTAVFGAATVLFAVLSGGWNGAWGTPQQVVRIVDVTLISVLAVLIAVVRVRREQQHERVAAIAEVAQRTILPTLPEVVGRVTTGVRYMSAAENAVVGGDLYDYYSSDTHVRFLIGDVRGKGVAAVEQAARVIRAFRQSAATQPTLPDVARDMSVYLQRFFDDEEFVTALLVDATEPGRLTVVSCGHPPALLVPATGPAVFVEAPPGLPLGLGEEYDARTVSWQPGDRLLLYTDGLSEARDGDGEFLRVDGLAPVLRGAGLDPALDGLLDAVRRHLPDGQLTDDLAVLLLEHNPAADRHPAGVPAPASR